MGADLGPAWDAARAHEAGLPDYLLSVMGAVRINQVRLEAACNA